MEAMNITEQAIVALDFKYGKQIVAALLPMGLTVVLHGAGIELVHRFFRRFGRPGLAAHGQVATIGTLRIVFQN